MSILYKHKQRETKTPSQNKMTATIIHESGKVETRNILGKGKAIREQARLNIIDSFYDTTDRVKQVIFNY
jgi:hypothetical protein